MIYYNNGLKIINDKHSTDSMVSNDNSCYKEPACINKATLHGCHTND